MIAVFGGRHEAEEFARALDDPSYGETADRYADLLQTVGLLREQEPPAPRPEFVADLRTRLLLEAEAIWTTPAAQSPTGSGRVVQLRPAAPRRRDRRLGAAAAALVLVTGTAGMAAAAQGSNPGDVLYPVKRGIEQAELGLQTSPAGRGKDLLGQADTRLHEVSDLISSGSTAQVTSTLRDFQKSADKGSNLLFAAYQRDNNDADIVAVRAFAASQMTQLRRLAALAPPTATPAFAAAADTLRAIDQQARVLCSSCSGGAALATPRSLVTLTSAHTLDTLFAAPVVRAEADAAAQKQALLRAEARRARNVATKTPLAKPHTPVGNPPKAATTAAGQATSNGSSTPLGQVTGKLTGNAAVKDLVKQVTSGVTSTTRTVTGTVTGTVTKKAKGAVKGVVGGLPKHP
ncbi:MAG: DUF5667 domain-containing protein [Actinomycetota bacterium]|nr:DUF5667 domain-containing protein [Actinomycetota bacterium]MDQ6933923.1 DUF5667 domain-containing protein [Actinomycetota bacterium]MDQ6936007.1 DUF5667 domain-containing protein [Actinomycetota bacterium]